MKLYLSSYKIGKETDILKNWIMENNNRICLVANAKDQFPDGERKEKGTQSDISQLEEVGFKVDKLDLRNYFGKKKELKNFLNDYKAIYVVGGNAFVLRRAMKLSGLDSILKEKSQQDFLYAGYSAGICVLSKDLHGIAVMDEPGIDPYNYGKIIYEGLGFLNYTPIPHYQSNHSETEMASRAVEFCKKNNIIYRTLRDGEVIVENFLQKKQNNYIKI